MARYREARIAFACLLMLLLVACGSDSKPISVSVSSAASTVSAGASAITLNATVVNDSKNAGVTWSLSPSTGCGTLSSSGATATYTPPSAATLNADCSATITAASAADSSKTSTATIAIKAISISVSSSSGSTTSFGAGATPVTLTATLANEATGANDSVTWSLSSTGNLPPAVRRAAIVGLTSNCGTLVPNGGTAVYTPPSSLGSNCTATITAASSINSNRKVTSTFSVSAITVAMTSPTLGITQFADSGNVSLTATIANDGANQGLLWSVSGCGTVTPGAASTTAVYTPPATPAAQCSAVVTAASVTDPGKSASAPTITINPIVAVAFTSTPPSSIAEGATQSLTAALTNDLGNQGLAWSLTPSGCGTLSATSGTTVNYVAPSTLASQCSATVTATSVADNRKKASSTIAVDLTAVSITSPGSNLDIAAGRTTSFTATISNDGTGQGIGWSLSPSTGCGTISPTTGANVMYTGPEEANLSSACTATVTASSVADSGKTASRQIKSNPISVSAITTTGGAAPPTMVGQGASAVPLYATISYDPVGAMNWNVSPSSCGTLSPVTPSGNTWSTSFIPAPSVSSDCAATITALSAANANRKSTVTITVKPLTVAITTPASNVNVTLGGTQALVASVVGDPSNAGVTWSLNPPMNCGVLSDVTLTSATFNAPPVGSSACQVAVIATSKTDGTKSSSVTLNVVPPAIVLTLVTPGPWNLNGSNNQGMSSRQINVSLQNDTTNQGVGWTNSNPDCGSLVPAASDSTAATFTAGQSGGLTTACQTTITATAVADHTKTVSGTMTVTPVSVNVSPNGNQSVTQGASLQFTATVNNEDPGGLGNFTTMGVAWTLNPSSGCGTLGNSSTTGVTYYAPSSLSQSCNVQLTATSAADTTKSVSLQITANPPSQPMSFNTSAHDINNGLVGQAYGMSFNVSGGTQPYTFSLASGALPTGLYLDSTHGNLSGTPTTAGSYTFTIKAQDNASNSVTSPSLTVKISSAPNHAHDSYLNGRYVCLVKGYNDSDGSGWTTISSIPFTGANSFTGGVFDNKSRGEAVSSGTLTGTVNIGSDNNGIITMTANSNYTTTWAAVLNNLAGSNSTEFHMTEIDDVGTSGSGQTGSADCYQATTSAFAASTLSGSSFAFEMSGEAGDGTPKAMLGRFSTSSGNITAGAGDFARGYNNNQQLTFTGTYTAPDSTTGRFTTSFTISGATANTIGYIVDAKRAFIMASDTSDGIQSGIARKQQQTTYTNANLNGNFAVYMQGHKFDTTSGSVAGYGAYLMQGTGNGSSGFTVNQSYELAAGVDSRGTVVVGNQNGTATGTVANNGRLSFNPGSNNGAVTIYLFDNNTGFIMDSTDADLVLGTVDAQSLATFTDSAVQGSYVFSRAGEESSSYGGSIGIVTLDTSGNVTGLNDSAGNGYYSWADAITATYSWSSTVFGTIQVSQGGTEALDCVSITSTKFACIEAESGEPNVIVMKK